MSGRDIHCRGCGQEYTEEDFRTFEFVKGGPAGYIDPITSESVTTSFEEIRCCCLCGADVVRRIDYDPDVDPPTERNPVPTMRPPPGVQ